MWTTAVKFHQTNMPGSIRGLISATVEPSRGKPPRFMYHGAFFRIFRKLGWRFGREREIGPIWRRPAAGESGRSGREPNSAPPGKPVQSGSNRGWQPRFGDPGGSWDSKGPGDASPAHRLTLEVVESAVRLRDPLRTRSPVASFRFRSTAQGRSGGEGELRAPSPNLCLNRASLVLCQKDINFNC